MKHRAWYQIWSRPWRQIITGEFRGHDLVGQDAEQVETLLGRPEYKA